MKEKSDSPTSSLKKRKASATACTKIGWAPGIILPIFLIAAEAAGLFLFLILLHPPAWRLPKISSLQNYGFAFAQKTQSWLNQSLVLNSAEITVDVTAEIPFWQRRLPFSYSDLVAAPKPPQKSLLHIVFDQLGAANPWQAFGKTQVVWGFDLSIEKIYNKLLSAVAPQIEREPQDAVLEITDGRAGAFRPDLTGRALDYYQTVADVKTALFRNTSIIVTPTVTSFPTLRLKDTNNLGINELVAHGESDFTGSSNNRITNIEVGAARFNGLILKPGEEFSFNQNLGPVTAKAGFKPEIVIKPEGQMPELGGGLCQVSTTAFRAALYGGLAITARRNHSFAVRYYAPQGTDATIYPGAVDLKFLNDTPTALLISTRVEGKKLIFDYYGTLDGREVKIDGPYQYDFGAGGAMKARLARTVTWATKKTTDEFFSKYVSRNLFPRVEEFPKPAQAAAEQPPAASPQTPNNEPTAPQTPPNSTQNNPPAN